MNSGRVHHQQSQNLQSEWKQVISHLFQGQLLRSDNNPRFRRNLPPPLELTMDEDEGMGNVPPSMQVGTSRASVGRHPLRWSVCHVCTYQCTDTRSNSFSSGNPCCRGWHWRVFIVGQQLLAFQCFRFLHLQLIIWRWKFGWAYSESDKSEQCNVSKDGFRGTSCCSSGPNIMTYGYLETLLLKHNKYVGILSIAVMTLQYITISMITIFSMYIVHVRYGSGHNSYQGHVNDSGEFWRVLGCTCIRRHWKRDIVDTFTHHFCANGHGWTIGTSFPYIRTSKRQYSTPVQYTCISSCLSWLYFALQALLPLKPYTRWETTCIAALYAVQHLVCLGYLPRLRHHVSPILP